MRAFSPFGMPLRTDLIPRGPLEQGPRHDLQSTVNSGFANPKIGSNRDDQSSIESNSNVTTTVLLDMRKYVPGDINQGEILFAINSSLNPSIKGDLNQAEHIMGLSRLNEWLRTSPEGLRLGKNKNGKYLREAIALRGILVTSMTQTLMDQKISKAVTVIVGGRAVTPDVTAWTRSNMTHRERDETQPGDYISICFRRILPQNPIEIEESIDFAPYWQAIPQRHSETTPPKMWWASVDYMIDEKDRFLGFYFPLGIVRTIVNGHDHKQYGVNDKVYAYNWKKEGRNLTHVTLFNEIPQMEIFMTLNI